MKFLLNKLVIFSLLLKSALCEYWGLSNEKYNTLILEEEDLFEWDENLGPSITNLTPLSSCSIYVKWDEWTGDDDLESYFVSWLQENITPEEESPLIESDTLEYTIQGLNSSSLYTVYVSAVTANSSFTGDGKQNSTTRTSDVVNLNAKNVESTRMDLEWGLADGSDCSLRYSISWNASILWDLDKQSSGADSSEEQSYYMSNLIPYSNYSICVYGADPTNSRGQQDCTEAQTLQGEAGPPRDISATAMNSSCVNVTWSEPVDKNGVISGYIVEGKIPSEEEIADPVQSNLNFALVPDLLACGNYTFTVQAQTNDGEISGDPATTQALTDSEVPPRVTKLNASEVGSTFANISWTAPDTLCLISYYNLTGFGQVLWEETNDAVVDENIEGDLTSYVLQDLVPMTNYSLCLHATTDSGPGEDECLVFETLQDVPSEPLNFTTAVLSSSEVSLNWDPPEENNGVLLTYQISWHTVGADLQSENTTDEDIVLSDLQACLVYNLTVSGVTVAGDGAPATSIEEMEPEVPPSPRDVNCKVQGPHSLQVTWQRSDTTCKILNYTLVATGSILWNEEETCATGFTTDLNYTLTELVPYTKYEVQLMATTAGGQGDSTSCSETTEEDVPGPPLDLNPIEDSINTDSFSITWMSPNVTNGQMKGFNITYKGGSQYVDYVGDENHVYRADIKSLDSGSLYTVFVRGETNAGLGEAATRDIVTDSDSLVVLITFLVLIILLVPLVAFGYIYRDKLGQKMKALRSAYPSSDYEEVAELNTAPIPLNQLRAHLGKLQNGNALHGEFNSLAAASYKGSVKEAEKAENQPRNRYANILPYDETRVQLRMGSSKYINANYIASFNYPKFFIATQGPKDNTLEDFWNMIWQENVDIIVMLASCIEGGKSKSCQYWPIPLGYGTDLGDYSIQNINEEVTSLFAFRMLEVTHKKENTKRLVKQYHYTTWPDFGAPERDDEILKLLSTVRKNITTSRENNKMVVHCSAGVGRTGTFIALWNLIEEIEAGSQSVSIVREVLSLRRQRVMMVQSQDQYLYLFKSIVAFVENQQKWQMKSQDRFSSSETQGPEPGEMTYGEGSTAMYDNNGFETNFGFEGNLI